jgi:hypothetical protein
MAFLSVKNTRVNLQILLGYKSDTADEINCCLPAEIC